MSVFVNAIQIPWTSTLRSGVTALLLLAAACSSSDTAPAANRPEPRPEDGAAAWSNLGCTEPPNVVETGLEISLRVDLADWESRSYAIHERVVVRPTKPGSAITLFGTSLALGKASHAYSYDGARATFCTGGFEPGESVAIDIDYVVSEKLQAFPDGNLAGIRVWQEGKGPAVIGSYASPFFASTWMLVPQTMPWLDEAHAGNVPIERVTLDVVVPNESWTVIGPGDAQAEGSEWRFSIDRPMPLYTVAFAASPSFVRGEGGASKSGVAISSAVSEGNRAAAAKRMVAIAKAIDWMDREIGAFPWAEPLTFAEIPRFPGGMEHTGGIWIGSPVLGSTDGDYVAVHETLHHWWGNDVRVADRPHFWLSEGLTEWTTVFAVLEAIAPESNLALQRSYRREAAEMSYGTSAKPAGPLRFPDGSDFAAQIRDNLLYFYRYGAAFLEMIDQRLRRSGSEGLGPILKEWFAKKSGKAVTTEEFRDFVAARSGDEVGMKRLFAEWTERGPCPTIELGAWSYDGGLARFTLRRTGGADQTLDAVEIAVLSGTTMTTKTVVVPKDASTTSVSIALPAAPSAIAVDPKGLYILRLRAPDWTGPSFGNALPE